MPRQYTPRVDRICRNCGTPFTCPPSDLAWNRGTYCSIACRRFWNTTSLESALTNYVTNERGCWVYQGATTDKGYPHVTIRGKQHWLHRIVMSRTHGIPLGDTKIFACHSCDNPPCINPEHIFPGTIQDNHADMVTKGRHVKGAQIPTNKLSPEQVIELRRRRADGERPSVLMKDYGITGPHVWNIVNRKVWKYLP